MHKPTRGGKPSFGGGKKFGGDRERGAPMRYDAVCAECRNKCQVPFRPNGKKPVLCRDCFGGGEGAEKKPFRRDIRPAAAPGADRSSAMEARILKEMNAKLDAILAALHA